MHGKPSSVNMKVRELMSEINREARKPFKDYKKIKNLWWRIYNLQRELDVSRRIWLNGGMQDVQHFFENNTTRQ
jgi:hypothetical protein